MTDDSTLPQVSEDLLTYLRSELNDAGIEYDAPLTRLTGGFETDTYRFSLDGAPSELARPLVLRVHRENRPKDDALRERIIQNSLADQGFPVARVHFDAPEGILSKRPFLIMDFLPGQMMAMSTPFETVGTILGTYHARLHDISPDPILETLAQSGLEERRYRFSGKLRWLTERGDQFPKLKECVDWVIANQPREPETLSICHGDFHPLNILIEDGRISAVLDWPGFMIGDPVFDIGATTFIAETGAKFLLGIEGVDQMIEDYLESYQSTRELDMDRLTYYRLVRAISALIQREEGQESWQHPELSQFIVDFVHKGTGVRVEL